MRKSENSQIKAIKKKIDGKAAAQSIYSIGNGNDNGNGNSHGRNVLPLPLLLL